MRIDISEKRIIKAIKSIRKLDNMDFPEIDDGDKQSELFEIISTLNDFSIDLEEEMY